MNASNAKSENYDKRTMIELRDVKKVFGTGDAKVEALRSINLKIQEREFVSVMGASGAGKSTCMNIIGCLDQASSGTYNLMGADITHINTNQMALVRRQFFGFVFQGFNLLGRHTALQNVELPLIYRGLNAEERKHRSLKALEDVGLKGREDHTPSELSGGQQQRVAFARAIVSEPEILVADEPTGNLDSTTSIEIMELMKKLNSEKGITIIMVTHEPEMAQFSKRLIQFVDGKVLNRQNTGLEENVL